LWHRTEESAAAAGEEKEAENPKVETLTKLLYNSPTN
jgi:hypothetical protein